MLLQFPPQQSAHIMASEETEVEDKQFYQAFGEHTGISEDCRDSIHRIKNNNQLNDNDEPMFRLDSDTEHFTVLSWTLLGRYIANNIN